MQRRRARRASRRTAWDKYRSSFCSWFSGKIRSPVTGESMVTTMMSIGALAKASGVPVKTIRYYSDEGLLPPRRLTASRYRLYSPEDRARLDMIRTLRAQNVDLATIRSLLQGKKT